VRFKSLSELKRPPLHKLVLAALPQEIEMTDYAKAKAFKINELIRIIHQENYEWYGYTIANRDDPELIVDIGLPKNEQNIFQYTSITPEKIADYQESLPLDTVINGWIHSHGNLEFKQFSSIDEENHRTVLDYVTALLRKPVAKKEVAIKDLALLVKDQYTDQDLEKGSVCLITDAPIGEARIMETIYGVFCYGIVIGDAGWHHQEIYYKSRGILSGQTTVSHREADLILIDSGRSLTPADIARLADEVKEKIQPVTYTLPKLEIL
jgi:hypothetical protein